MRDERSVRVPGGALHVQAAGSGPPALLLHGGPGMSDYLEELAELLASELRCYRYTQRGVPPAPETGPYTVERHVADALAVIDALDLDRVAVVGHSWGGYLAVQLATAAPERVTALVSVDGLGITGDGGWPAFDEHFARSLSPEEAARAEEIDRRAYAGEASDEDAAAQLRISWPYYFADPGSAPAMPGFVLRGEPYSETAVDVKALLAGGSLAERVGAVEVPALFLRGSASGFPAWVAEQAAEAMPRGRAATIHGAGHFIWMERPEEARAAIVGFLREVGATP